MSLVLYGSHSLLQGGLLDPGIEPGSPTLQSDSLPSNPPQKPKCCTGHPDTERQLLMDLKSSFAWASCVLSSNPTVRLLKRWPGRLWGSGSWPSWVLKPDLSGAQFLIKDHPLGGPLPELMKEKTRVFLWTWAFCQQGKVGLCSPPPPPGT